MKFSKQNAKGFSLIELLIVVAIILIIAAIAIPNLMRSKIAANQASAVGSLRTIDTAEVTYASTYNVGYSGTLADLGPVASGSQPSTTTADLIDSVLAGGNKSGYTFAYSAATAVNSQVPSYQVTAAPQQQGTTGQNGYYTDQTNVIRYDTSGSATGASTPIGG
ncbi:MAG TPA: prepilin-type N-terminal cleavage/methylation domain-containing protein [Terriglobia bacterium]|nr:prepilin-type N-terminal cleavage/methylation domain-containing protein [Terriglobia bacterium]